MISSNMDCYLTMFPNYAEWSWRDIGNGRQTIHSNANCISRRETSVQVIRTKRTLSRWYFSQNMSGGILLVVCVMNGNQQIQIVSVAIVSIENEANWSFFLRNLGMILPVKPSFILSDRAKRLIHAVSSVYPSTYHFYCFHHLMENYNRKFRSVE